MNRVGGYLLSTTVTFDGTGLDLCVITIAPHLEGTMEEMDVREFVRSAPGGEQYPSPLPRTSRDIYRCL